MFDPEAADRLATQLKKLHIMVTEKDLFSYDGRRMSLADLLAEHTAVLKEHTTALREHTSALVNLRQEGCES